MARHPAETVSVLTYRTGIQDANLAGNVHGGWVMKLCDDVAVIAATRLAGGRVVTAAGDAMKVPLAREGRRRHHAPGDRQRRLANLDGGRRARRGRTRADRRGRAHLHRVLDLGRPGGGREAGVRSEEHTSELQSHSDL